MLLEDNGIDVMVDSGNKTAASLITLLNGTLNQRISAARTVKNAVVGNPTNKRLYLRLGVLPLLLDAAVEIERHPALAKQAVAALGSLSMLVPADALLQVTPVLTAALFSPDTSVVNAAARALKMLVTAERADGSALGPLIASSEVARRLVELLSEPDEGIAEVCALIVAKTSVAKLQAKYFESAGAVSALLKLLRRTNHEKCIEACLNAMSELAGENSEIAEVLSCRKNIFLVLPFTRGRLHSLRLSACRLLMIFHSVAHLPSGLEGVVTTSLVDLLNTDDTCSKIATAQTLVELVLGWEVLQSMAGEAGAITKLANVSMSLEDTADTAPLQAATLTAIAALSSEFDGAREDVISLQLLPCVVRCLSSTSPDVVLASVKCIRSLSRSVKVLWRDLSNESVGPVLLDLLASKSSEICREVSATLCNFMIEFSPIRLSILGRGVPALIDCLYSEDNELRRNSLWALKNSLFKADSDTRISILTQIGYDSLRRLCTEGHPEVRELSMNIIRNLANSGSSQSQSEQLNVLFGETGRWLITLLSEALRIDSEHSEFAVQALYAVCNIASGSELHKKCLIDSEIPQLLLQWTSHKNERARIAAVWCVINLAWKEKQKTERQPSSVITRLQQPERSRYDQRRLGMLRQQHISPPSSPLGRDLHGTNLSNISLMTSMRERDNSESPSVERRQVSCGRVSQEMDTADDAVRNAHTLTAPKTVGYDWRIERLRALGFETRLRSLLRDDPHVEVQGRARVALELFDTSIDPMDADPSALLDRNPSVIVSQMPRSYSILSRVAESDSSSGGP